MSNRNGYIGRAPADSTVTVARQSFAPTGVTTDFTFASGYTPGYFDLFINGVKMIEGSDFTSTDGSTFVVLNGGAQNGDVLEGVAYKAFNAVSVNNAPGNFTVGGNLTVNGTASFSGAGSSVSFATTAYALEGTPDLTVRNLTGVAATFTGVVTYEDVTNIDSVGIVTAQSGINIVGGGLTVTGVSTFFNDITIGTGSTVGFGTTAYFNDNARAIFGDGEDLQIYHDGSNSYIAESGTGRLRLLSNIIDLKNTVDNAVLARFTSGGSVDLRYDNSTKFETTTDGVVITGIATATSFFGDGSGLSGVGGENDITSSLFI